jgi:hypothetical protein
MMTLLDVVKQDDDDDDDDDEGVDNFYEERIFLCSRKMK